MIHRWFPKLTFATPTPGSIQRIVPDYNGPDQDKVNLHHQVSEPDMSEQLVPILRVKDGYATAKWYARLGFEIIGEHRFAPELPLYLFLKRQDTLLHLSEHKGDASPGTLLYLYVANIEPVAHEFDIDIIEQPWAREVHLQDPDGNRLRIGQLRHTDS